MDHLDVVECIIFPIVGLIAQQALERPCAGVHNRVAPQLVPMREPKVAKVTTVGAVRVWQRRDLKRKQRVSGLGDF